MSFGLTLIQSLAHRGAHVIALSLAPAPIDSPDVEVLVSLISSTTENEHIYAEECDLTSSTSVQAFCDRFLTGQDQPVRCHPLCTRVSTHRPHILDSNTRGIRKREKVGVAGYIYDHHTTSPCFTRRAGRTRHSHHQRRQPFLCSRSPFVLSLHYHASRKAVDFLQDGLRSLRMVVLTRHLQRVLDALPHAPAPPTNEGTSAVPVVNTIFRRSNIVAMAVSPGISRLDTLAPCSTLTVQYFQRRTLCSA